MIENNEQITELVEVENVTDVANETVKSSISKGVVIGGTIGLFAAIGGVIHYLRKRRKNKKAKAEVKKLS